MNSRDQLAAFLTRCHIAGEAMDATSAAVLAGQILAVNNLTEAELAAQGYLHLTVEHGDIESADEAAAVRHLWTWSDRHPGAIRQSRGTNDTTTWLFPPPHAAANRDAMQAVAHEHNPGFWNIRRSAR
jgi:hypothetical protein